MPGFLERLRQKPQETRKRYALGTSAAVTGLIFVMWLTVLNHGFLESDAQIRSLNNKQVNQTASPLSAFGSNAASAFQQFQDEFSGDDAAATGTASTSEANPAGSNLPNRGTAGTNQPSSPGDYWGSEASGVSSQVQGDTDEPESSDDVPFTSRNYNPQQESDWFAR